MFERTRLRKLILAFFFRILASVIVASIIITACVGQINKINASIIEKNKLARILDQKSETLRELEQNLAVIGTNDKKILEALPPSNNILDFIAVLENLAARTSVRQTMRFGTPVAVTPAEAKGVGIARIDYTMAISGNVHTLFNYMKNFEHLPYFTRINSFSVQSGNELGWEGESTISISASVFVQDSNF